MDERRCFIERLTPWLLLSFFVFLILMTSSGCSSQNSTDNESGTRDDLATQAIQAFVNAHYSQRFPQLVADLGTVEVRDTQNGEIIIVHSTLTPDVATESADAGEYNAQRLATIMFTASKFTGHVNVIYVFDTENNLAATYVPQYDN